MEKGSGCECAGRSDRRTGSWRAAHPMLLPDAPYGFLHLIAAGGDLLQVLPVPLRHTGEEAADPLGQLVEAGGVRGRKGATPQLTGEELGSFLGQHGAISRRGKRSLGKKEGLSRAAWTDDGTKIWNGQRRLPLFVELGDDLPQLVSGYPLSRNPCVGDIEIFF